MSLLTCSHGDGQHAGQHPAAREYCHQSTVATDTGAAGCGASQALYCSGGMYVPPLAAWRCPQSPTICVDPRSTVRAEHKGCTPMPACCCLASTCTKKHQVYVYVHMSPVLCAHAMAVRFGRALRVLRSIAVLSSVLPPASMRELALGNLIQVRCHRLWAVVPLCSSAALVWPSA